MRLYPIDPTTLVDLAKIEAISLCNHGEGNHLFHVRLLTGIEHCLDVRAGRRLRARLRGPLRTLLCWLFRRNPDRGLKCPPPPSTVST